MRHRLALMGNVPPLDVGVRESPEMVAQWAKTCLDKAAPGGGMILSVGGGVSPGMPAENLDAMLAAARAWKKPSPEELEALHKTPTNVESEPKVSRKRRSRRAR